MLRAVTATTAFAAGKLAGLVGAASVAVAASVASVLAGPRRAGGERGAEEERRGALRTVGTASLMAYVQVRPRGRPHGWGALWHRRDLPG